MEQEDMAEANSKIYQFKITLVGGPRPLVWRCIQVPETYSFWDLHVAIQDAMGWKDYHLHQFKITNLETAEEESIGLPDDSGYNETIFGKNAKIAKYFLEPGDIAMYEYDFGACWEHEIRLEKILPATPGEKYPKCVAGEHACPPEDCHIDYDEWMATKVDFDPNSVVFDDPATRPMLM